jgi:hypothetical protein
MISVVQLASQLIDEDFRCACRACRFKKCVDVGMTSTGVQMYPDHIDVLSIK